MAFNGLLTRQVSHDPLTAYSSRVTRPPESERSATRARHSLARAGPAEREDRACHHAKTIAVRDLGLAIGSLAKLKLAALGCRSKRLRLLCRSLVRPGFGRQALASGLGEVLFRRIEIG